MKYTAGMLQDFSSCVNDSIMLTTIVNTARGRSRKEGYRHLCPSSSTSIIPQDPTKVYIHTHTTTFKQLLWEENGEEIMLY